ncbi:MAG TPA: hypothetical protein VL624_05345 [Caldimonas sp.]|jgi:hypothetical protein|nr:hypothetical protein [Caldimonas sp.]
MSDPHAAAAAPASDVAVAEQLAHVHGPGELRAVMLALLLPPGSKRALRAWQVEVGKLAGAETLCAHATSLSGASRLPWFERLLARMAAQPLAARKELLLAARRLMESRGVARPIDRLHWLMLRRGLGEALPLATRPEAHPDDVEWLESDIQSVAAYTAFLSRMVPGDIADAPQGEAWYQSVMASFPGFEIPPRQPPKAAAMVETLERLQTLSWMQRPVVIRTWVATALAQSRFGRLTDLSADALRMTCALLDAPQPPELARHYIALAGDGMARPGAAA